MEGGRLLRKKREGETTGSSRARGKRPPVMETNGLNRNYLYYTLLQYVILC